MTIRITRTVDVKDLTPEDIKLLDKDTLQKIAIELTSKPSEPLVDTNTHPKPPKALRSDPQASKVKASSVLRNLSKKSTSSGIHKGHEIGTKTGLSSEYHYVYWHTASKSYRTTHSNSPYPTELEAAIASDKTLDDRNDTERPRNRDEFPEVRNYTSIPGINSYIDENIT